MLAAAIGLGCALAAAASFFLAPLNGNLRYEAGVKIVSTHSAAATFSHRPLAFRLVMDAVFRAADSVGLGMIGFEMAVRLLLTALAIGAGLLLWRGLRCHGVPGAQWYAIVVVGSLILLGLISVGEPDWMAVLFAVAGIGAALLGVRRPWLFALLAGIFLVAATGMKIVSLPTALMALAVVALIDRAQAVRTTVAAALVGVLYLGATLLWVPWEIQWLWDIRSVQNDARAALPEAPDYFWSLIAERPVLAALPAALVLTGWRERMVTVAAVVLCVIMVIGQGQYFDYHAIPLIVVAAVAVFRGLSGRVGPAIGSVVLGVVLAATALTATSSAWRDDHQRLWASGLVLFAMSGLVWALVVRSRPADRSSTAWLLATVTTMALLYPGASPWASNLIKPTNPDGSRPASTLENRIRKQATAERVHEVVGGPQVPVTYLTFGEWTYFLRNPTSCRYPSPLFLQRTRKPARLGTASYRENVACLNDADARWLVWDTTWFYLKPQPAEVKQIIAREWDCDAAVRVAELKLCPRR